MKITINKNGEYDQGEACKGKNYGSVVFVTAKGNSIEAMIGRSSFLNNCYIVEAYDGSSYVCSFSIILDVEFDQAASVIAGIVLAYLANKTNVGNVFNLTMPAE